MPIMLIKKYKWLSFNKRQQQFAACKIKKGSAVCRASPVIHFLNEFFNIC